MNSALTRYDVRVFRAGACIWGRDGVLAVDRDDALLEAWACFLNLLPSAILGANPALIPAQVRRQEHLASGDLTVTVRLSPDQEIR